MNFSTNPVHTIENLTTRYKTKTVSIYLAIVVAVIVGIVLLPVIKIEVSRQSRGMVRSHQEKVPLQAVVTGKVLLCKLKNNKQVHKGDTLLQIAQDNLQTEKNNTQLIAQDNTTLCNDLQNAIISKNKFATPLMMQEWYSYTTKCNELQEKINYAQQDYERYKKLYDKGVVSNSEFEKYNHAYLASQQAYAVFVKNQKAQWENRHRELAEKNKNLSNTIKKIDIDSKNYYITAPATGVIENYSGIQVGSFLNNAQPIAVLSPVDNLIVECTVQPNDIGLLHKGQKVQFQLDAFNYNQWGLAQGKIIDIDKNITLQENQAYFKVRCTLQSKKMQLKSGFQTVISNGMTLTARYTIARRSLYNLLFDKVDNWLNPKLSNGKI